MPLFFMEKSRVSADRRLRAIRYDRRTNRTPSPCLFLRYFYAVDTYGSINPIDGTDLAASVLDCRFDGQARLIDRFSWFRFSPKSRL